LINDSEGPLKDAHGSYVYSDVISYINSRATFYRKLVERKGAVP